MTSAPQVTQATLARFKANIRVTTDGCWLWTGKTDTSGYGRWTPVPGQRRYQAHIWSYLVHRGTAAYDPDMQVDHLCHRVAIEAGTCKGGVCQHRLCCNPAHLELVTPSENTRRQDHAERRKQQCPKGHPYDYENTINRNGRRYCRRCEAERKRVARAKAKGTDAP